MAGFSVFILHPVLQCKDPPSYCPTPGPTRHSKAYVMRDLLLLLVVLAVHTTALTVVAAGEDQGGSTAGSTSSNQLPVLTGQRIVSVLCPRLYDCLEPCTPV